MQMPIFLGSSNLPLHIFDADLFLRLLIKVKPVIREVNTGELCIRFYALSQPLAL
jgi:hypothetical protein